MQYYIADLGREPYWLMAFANRWQWTANRDAAIVCDTLAAALEELEEYRRFYPTDPTEDLHIVLSDGTAIPAVMLTA